MRLNEVSRAPQNEEASQRLTISARMPVVAVEPRIW